MKVAILIDLLVPGGVQKAAIEEVQNLRKLGHDAELFCLTRTRYDYQYEDLLRGLSVTYLSDQNPWPFRTTRKLPFFAFLTTNHLLCPLFARRYRQLTKTDFVIVHGTTTCLTAMAIKRHFGVPYIAFIWDPMVFILHTVYNQGVLKYLTPLLDPAINFLERRITREATQVLTPSSVHKRRLEKTYGVKAAVIAPGHDFAPTKISKIRTYILGYSRWQREKHPEFFLKLSRLTKIPIVMAGLWTDKAALTRFQETISREQLNIKLIGKVTQEDIPKLAAGAIAWVHPHFEAFGMPGLELAAHGIPIVIIQGSGVTDLFKDGVHGYFPPSRKAMIRAVQKLARNKNKALAMGKAAMGVARRYTWEFHTQKLAQLLNS